MLRLTPCVLALVSACATSPDPPAPTLPAPTLPAPLPDASRVSEAPSAPAADAEVAPDPEEAPGWSALDAERRAAVGLLHEAPQLESSHLYDDASPSPLGRALRELIVGAPSPELLRWLAAHATPAGRIYAVLGLEELGDPAARSARQRVLADVGEAPLLVAVGCGLMYRTAVSLLDDGWLRSQVFTDASLPPRGAPWEGEALARRYRAVRLRDPGGRPVIAEDVQVGPGATCVTRDVARTCFGRDRIERYPSSTAPCLVEGGRIRCRRPDALAPAASERPIEGPEDVVELLALVDRHFVARERAGRVWTFRVDDEGTARDVAAAALDDIVELFPLSLHDACVRREAGEVRCFGPRLPAETPDDDALIVRGLPRLTHVEDGRGHTCGLTPGGAVYCWGQRGAHVGTSEP